jgi:hypothetical protein
VIRCWEPWPFIGAVVEVPRASLQRSNAKGARLSWQEDCAQLEKKIIKKKKSRRAYAGQLSQDRVHLLVTGGDGLSDVCIVPVRKPSMAVAW